jgi:hypothetical protein
MERNPQFQKVKKTQEALRYQFISTELDMALTFAGSLTRQMTKLAWSEILTMLRKRFGLQDNFWQKQLSRQA